jgi:hypothetical protein
MIKIKSELTVKKIKLRVNLITPYFKLSFFIRIKIFVMSGIILLVILTND